MSKNNSKNQKLLSKKVPLYIIIILIFINGCIWYIINPNSGEADTVNNSISINSYIDQIRQTDYEFTCPLLLVDINHEDEKLSYLKKKINDYIHSMKQSGTISTASVYMRRFADGGWFAINENELYSPGSLLKVSLLITYLKEAEHIPGLLNRKIFFENHFSTIIQPNFLDKKLIPGNYYTVRELLQYMIVYSNNDATILLMSNTNLSTYKKLYADLKLKEPETDQIDYLINIVDCSKFFRILFNATYLSKEMSEYALKLLSQTTFNDGLLKSIDKDIPVAHKFGERGSGDVKQLHELGIIYLNKNPYILGVMTKGTDYDLLPNVVSGISALVYEEMRNGY